MRDALKLTAPNLSGQSMGIGSTTAEGARDPKSLPAGHLQETVHNRALRSVRRPPIQQHQSQCLSFGGAGCRLRLRRWVTTDIEDGLWELDPAKAAVGRLMESGPFQSILNNPKTGAISDNKRCEGARGLVIRRGISWKYSSHRVDGLELTARANDAMAVAAGFELRREKKKRR